MVTFSNKLMKQTSRPSQYLSSDIDGDSVIEIPETDAAPGYDEYSDSDKDKQYLTTWKVYKDSYSLEDKYTGYYKISDGYAFMFPDGWKNNITVKIDEASGEAVFYKFNKNLYESDTELLRLNVVDSSEIKRYTDQGYKVMRYNDQIAYIAKISNSDDKFGIDFDIIKSNLYLTD